MKDGYCDDCPNPIECYQMGTCWPLTASINHDMKIDLKKLWAAMPRDVQMKISCYDLQRITDNYNGETRPTSESKRAAAETADEKPDGQAENDERIRAEIKP